MLRLLILISIFPFFVFGQEGSGFPKDQQTKAYCQVIAEYIKVIGKEDQLSFDTLYIGKHPDFPEIKLPAIIQGKKIILLTYHKGDKEPQNKSSFILINIIEKKVINEEMNFMLVTFHQDYHPQHNSFFDLKYDPAKKEFVLNKDVRFDHQYIKK
ncbi:MAG: hypothetical protein ABIP51_17765 [Bacteroidia bacterium]